MARARPARVGRDRRAAAARPRPGLLRRLVPRGAAGAGSRRWASAGRSAGACATTTGCAASAAGWWPPAGCATSAPPARATACTARSPTSPRATCAWRAGSTASRRSSAPRPPSTEVSALGHRLELERTWTTRTGEGRLELVDVTRNLGPEPEPAPLLYHVNLGAPLWSPGATLALQARAHDAARRAMRSSRGTARSSPRGRARARLRARRRVGEDGWCAAAVDSPATGLRLLLRWEAASLPRFHHGCTPRRGSRVLGLEPANCSRPRPRRRPRGGAPAPCSSRARSASRAWRSASPHGVDASPRRFARVGSGTSHFPPGAPRLSLDDPVIITCAISGALANREQCPAIPYTPEEYARRGAADRRRGRR